MRGYQPMYKGEAPAPPTSGSFIVEKKQESDTTEWLDSSMPICAKCGYVLPMPSGTPFCPACGRKAKGVKK